ncbi:collagen-like domain-containing protein [Amycolatopsis thermophila]|uniref:Proteins of 100 residues with WXG n=1 Tax=Amycolatopsis thermophila TaxID=206084 RepID=A0ABU0EQC7_9PSEU|nr:hypothetical protein [Amycolatopsis thermophila]MDQ0377504.1 hypothetical protein [Amycolatopsis thermophila]
MAQRLPTIQEVQQLVDDPKIDDDTKRTLLTRYFDAIDNVDPVVYGFTNDNQKKQLLEQYQDRFGFDATDLRDGPYAYDAYSKAQGQHDANLDAAREAEKRAVGDGKARLDGLTGKASDIAAGAGNSNEILDTAVAGLDTFRNWLPVYRKARAIVAPGLPDFGLQQDILDRYDEQRDIPFDKFAAGVNEIVQVRESVADASPTQNQAMQNLFGQWEGDGKNAASASWAKFGDGVKTVEQTLEHAADVINRTIAAIAASCREKASWVLRFSFQVWPQNGGLTAQEMDRLARIAELGRNASADDFKHLLGYLLATRSPLAGQLMAGESFGMSDELLDAVQAWAKQQLTDFCTWFSRFVGDFQTMCENTRVAVASQWSALNTELQKVPDNPFAAVGEAAAAPPARTAARGGSGGSGSSGGSGGSGGGAGGGPAGSGGGAGAVPPAAPAVVPPAPAGPAAAPPVVPPEPGERDTLTVQRGDSRIEMSEPDRNGRMGITIDTGPGEAKDYQLNWGAADPSQPSAYTPGADGKIHIDDGGLRITAERPEGPAGATVVTIDDGTGTPTTYTLGEEPLASTPMPPAGPGAVNPLASNGGALSPGQGGSTGVTGSAHSAGLTTDGTSGGPAGLTEAGTAQGVTGGPVGSAQSVGLAGDAGLVQPGGTDVGTAQGVAGGPVAGAQSAGLAGDAGVAQAGGIDVGTAQGVAGGPVAGAQSAGLAGDAGVAQAGGIDVGTPHGVTGGPVGSGQSVGLAGDAGVAQAGGIDGGTAQGVTGGPVGSGQSVGLAGDAGVAQPGLPAESGTTVPAHAVGGVADGLAPAAAVSGSLGDPRALDQPVPAAAGATLGTAPGLDPAGSGVAGDDGGMSMMPPMGGGAAQGGDDPERTSRAYRVDGDIFETAGSVGRISGSLDDEESGR